MSRRDICNEGPPGETPQEAWRRIYGTDDYGNLPGHYKHTHEGHCWQPCPYSSTAPLDWTVAMLGGMPATRVDHVVGNRSYYMKTQSRGNRWGFECTFDGCTFFLENDIRYFYV